MSKLNKSLKEKILEQLQLGDPLTKIIKTKGMPSLSTVYREMRDDTEFNDHITKARINGAHTWGDKAMEILEQNYTPQEMSIVREKLIHIRWLMSKLIPNYNDKLINEHKGENKIVFSWEDPNLKGNDTDLTRTLRGSDETQKLPANNPDSNPDTP
jgi:hypothetical protein